MEYRIVDTLSKGKLNSRYLVKDTAGLFFSIKKPEGTFRIGECFSADTPLDSVNQKWIDSYNKGHYPRKAMMGHLTWYKENVLLDLKKGTYGKSGNKIYSHIFDDPYKNLITDKGYDCQLSETMASLGKTFREDFRHLNSSQAFAVNFFTPLIHDRKLCYLDPCFGNPLVQDCCFELVLDKAEKTQFDFYSNDIVRGCQCSVEVKYSENSFGATKSDEKHLKKREKEYRQYMTMLAINDVSDSQFYDYYQVWRNLLYTVKNKGQHICFLFPKFRGDLKQTIECIIGKCKEEYRPFFHIIYADDVVNSIIESNSPMRPFYEEFKKKYLDIDVIQ